MKINEKLPKEMVDLILEYVGYHRWRYGKYITCLSENDPRRKFLQKKRPILKRNGELPFWEVLIRIPFLDRINIYSLSVRRRVYAHGDIQYYWLQQYLYHCDNPDWKDDDYDDYDDDDEYEYFHHRHHNTNRMFVIH